MVETFEQIALKNTPLTIEPYPHFVIDNFFDDYTYHKMLEMWPYDEEMIAPRSYSRQLDLLKDPLIPGSEKGEWEIEEHLEGEKLEFWRSVRRRLCGMNFVHMLKEKYGIAEAVYPHCRLMVDYEGSGLGPHTDRYDKVASGLLYIGEEKFGCPTKILKPKKKLERSQEHYDFKDFEVVREVEHKPNRFFSFLVSHKSFHSFYQEVPVPRRTIKYFLQRYVDVENAREDIEKTKELAERWREESN